MGFIFDISRQGLLYMIFQNMGVIFFQVVVNGDMTFSYIDANFPGSANDAYIMKSSPVWNFGMEGNFDVYHLLGDSG